MAAVQSPAQRLWHRVAMVLVLMLLVIMMIPLYWIGSTAFKARVDATTVPPTVFFKPEVSGFVRLFTTRVQRRGAIDPEAYAPAPWGGKQGVDGGGRFIKNAKGEGETSPFP